MTLGRWPRRPPSATLDRMIAVEHLTKRYGRQLAVDDVSFRCEPGTVTGFLGPNGAGKSTTMRMICGLTPPTAGTATVARHAPTAACPTRAARSACCWTRPPSTPAAPAARCCRSRRMVQGVEHGARRRAAGAGRPRRAAAQASACGNYSLGMRQRLGIAQALLGDPRVLILDEPANGLDPEGIFWMRGLLRDFADRGGTVLLSSHLLREVEAVADQPGGDRQRADRRPGPQGRAAGRRPA